MTKIKYPRLGNILAGRGLPDKIKVRPLLIDAAFHGVLHSLPDFRQKSVYLPSPRIAPRIPSSIGLCARSTPLCPSWCSSGNLPALEVAHFLVFQGASSYRKYRPLVLG